MKFTLVRDLREDALMRPLLAGLLLFALLFLGADALLKSEQLGLAPSALAATLYGDEENYVDPMPATSLTEQVHASLFFMMFTLLTLGATYVRLAGGRGLRMLPMHLSMLAGLSDPALLLLAYYGDDAFVLPWLGAFWLWHAGALFMALASLARLVRPGR